jgi:hypothetical protein
LFSEPSDIQNKWWFEKNCYFHEKILNKFFYSTFYIIFTVSMVLQSRQNMKKSMYLGPFQNKIFQNIFLFCPPLKYFSLPILLSEQIVRKYNFIFIFFPPSVVDLSKF